jgi:hypothetical protein
VNLRLIKSRAVLLLLFIFVAAVVTGCASTESENVSARPWNTPKGWETGFPTSIMEGR